MIKCVSVVFQVVSVMIDVGKKRRRKNEEEKGTKVNTRVSYRVQTSHS